MKKILYLLLFTLLVVNAASAQTGWVTQNLSTQFSVKFPVAPQKVSNNGIDIYIAKSKDSVSYIANLVDFQMVANIDSATLASIKETPEFANQLKTGMASTMGNVTLGDVTVGKWKGYTTYKVSGQGGASKGRLSVFMILDGTKMYTLSCIIPEKITAKVDEDYYATAQTMN